ncbi:NlpC/P60 family protein [Streptomyces sp. NPDC050610]|uniref:C40 family peptidase n=1 Tax=Streptomyces sp. NPDC050610 TaxID=3157097 RepID=UPI0034423A27
MRVRVRAGASVRAAAQDAVVVRVRVRTVARGAVVAAVALACVAGAQTGPGPAYAEPQRPGSPGAKRQSLEEVRTEVDSLYRKAEAATDAYNAAGERQSEQERAILKIARAVVAAQDRMAGLRNRAGAMARAQYRSGGMPAEARMLFGGDPAQFLDNAALARKGQQAARGLIADLAATRTALDGYAKAASEQWEQLADERAKRADAKKEIEERLRTAKHLESRLAAKERDRLRQLEEERANAAQEKWLGAGAPKGGGGAATELGKRAVAFATAQIGKDYVWGAVGPNTFDCSGLTLQAWAAAGRSIPRTSQEQWRQLPKVDARDMRPGDLVIYFSDASHVGMYVGGGAIVHAPRPGRQVTLAGAGSMPVLGVVRPDA